MPAIDNNPSPENMRTPFPNHSYWVVPGKLLAGYYPGDADPQVMDTKLNALLDCGVTVVISLMEADEDDLFGRTFPPYQDRLRELAWQRGKRIRWQRMPIRDFDVPSEAEMTRILNTIDQAIEQGETVYVHCLGGIGRTGTVVGCYLARHGIARGEAALKKIQELRRGLDDYRTSPETAAQRQMVKRWREHQ